MALPVPPSKKKISLGGKLLDRGSKEEQGAPPPLRSYLFLTMLACFCPACPVNIVGLVYSFMSRSCYYQGDYEGSRRLGRNALFVSVASIIIGLLVIAFICVVRFTEVAK